MKLKVDEIKIGSRIRQEIGDLTELKESIKEVGLLQPILINSDNELLSGLRRLEACRQLGWLDIEVKVMETGSDDVKKLDLEYHENLGRMNFTEDETLKYGESRYSLLHPPQPEKGLWAWLKKIWEKIVALLSRVKKSENME